MAVRYVLSKHAVDDIMQILEYIDANDANASSLFEEDLYRAFDLLVEYPGVGHERSDLTDLPVRFWSVRKQFLIIYRQAKPLEIVRVLSGFRDIALLLNDEVPS